MPGISELAREEEELELNTPTLLEASVREFRETFDASTDPALWERLIKEEEAEVIEALANLLKELTDFHYVLEGYVQVGGDLSTLGNPQLPHWASEVFHSIPFPIHVEALNRVHASNMSKLGEDGKPIRREDGKVLKGPNYKPADLSDLVKND